MYIIQSGCTIEAVMCPMTMRHATMASDYYKIGLRRHYSLIVRLERWVSWKWKPCKFFAKTTYVKFLVYCLY